MFDVIDINRVNLKAKISDHRYLSIYQMERERRVHTDQRFKQFQWPVSNTQSVSDTIIPKS